MSVADYDFRMLRDDLITRAFRVVGVVGVDDTLTAGQLKQGVDILNAIVKTWQLSGTLLWTWATFEIELEVGEGVYELPDEPPILSIEGGKVLHSGGGISTVEPISYVEYLKLYDIDEPGLPTLVANNGAGELCLWPVPDNSAYETFQCIGVRRAKDWDSSTSNGEFPAAWTNALVYAIAADLSAEYGVPLSERRLLRGEAEAAYNLARRHESPRSNRSFVKSAYLP